jgi:hypothetical protein
LALQDRSRAQGGVGCLATLGLNRAWPVQSELALSLSHSFFF